MGKIVLLAVAAAWAAVLLPPLLRSRLENRPGSSVTDFRRQLSTLQRTVPTRTMTPMRSMARPLASSSLQRPAVTGGPGHPGRMHRGHDLAYSGELQRREHTSAAIRGRHPQQARRISHREVIRRRRTNVLFVLLVATASTLFLAATTQSSAMVYAFTFSFVSLCGYVYKLAQLRQFDENRLYSDAHWFHAA